MNFHIDCETSLPVFSKFSFRALEGGDGEG